MSVLRSLRDMREGLKRRHQREQKKNERPLEIHAYSTSSIGTVPTQPSSILKQIKRTGYRTHLPEMVAFGTVARCKLVSGSGRASRVSSRLAVEIRMFLVVSQLGEPAGGFLFATAVPTRC